MIKHRWPGATGHRYKKKAHSDLNCVGHNTIHAYTPSPPSPFTRWRNSKDVKIVFSETKLINSVLVRMMSPEYWHCRERVHRDV